MIPAIERFLSKINVVENGCWEWTACKNNYGYGQININSKILRAHRFIYEYYHGMIDPNLTIDHLCRNRKCVNVNHLEQVSMKINTRRGMSPSGINFRKTHCPQGHEYTPKNTISESGGRRCKICNIHRKQVWRKNNLERHKSQQREWWIRNKNKIKQKKRKLELVHS